MICNTPSEKPAGRDPRFSQGQDNNGKNVGKKKSRQALEPSDAGEKSIFRMLSGVSDDR